MAGTGTPVGASASMMRAWRSMSCRPIGFWPGGTDLTTSAPSLVSHPVGQPGVAAGQPCEEAHLDARAAAAAGDAATRRHSSRS